MYSPKSDTGLVGISVGTWDSKRWLWILVGRGHKFGELQQFTRKKNGSWLGMLTHIAFLNLGTLCKDRQQTLRDLAVWNENGGSSFIAGANNMINPSH